MKITTITPLALTLCFLLGDNLKASENEELEQEYTRSFRGETVQKRGIYYFVETKGKDYSTGNEGEFPCIIIGVRQDNVEEAKKLMRLTRDKHIYPSIIYRKLLNPETYIYNTGTLSAVTPIPSKCSQVIGIAKVDNLDVNEDDIDVDEDAGTP